MAMNTEDSLREYLRLFVKVPLLGKIGPLARTFDFVADAAPGVKEILAVGKLCHEVRERHYDLVVVDAEATGHIVAQVGAPKVIRDLVKVGLVRDQTEWMLELLQDPAITGVAIVTTPEEMPVTETLGLLDRLEPETGVRADACWSPIACCPNDSTGAIERCSTSSTRPAARSQPLPGAASRRARRRPHDRGAPRQRRLGISTGCVSEAPDLPIVEVPELFTRATGRRVVALVADSLAEQIDTAEAG